MATKMQAACPKCRQQYSIAEGMTGRTVRCSKCNTSFVLSGDDAGAPAPRASSSTAGGPPRSTSGGGAKPGTAANLPAVIGPYQVRRLLGQGAFGVVYLAYHPFLDIEVAVKMLRAEALSSAQSVERFLREAKVLARMDHPNVLRVYDAGKHGNDYYIASAFIPGKDLGAVIPEGGLEPKRAVRLALQMLRALGYAHAQGIVHRDVKPANARLTDQDTLYLMDFGLAGWAAQEVVSASAELPERLTRAGAVVGTPAYMAPEQAAGLTDQAGPAADLYSAGVVLYELLTGELPFEGPNLVALLYAVVHSEPAAPSSLRPGLDRRLDAICLKAMAKRPEDRYRTAEEFAAALEAWLAGNMAAPVPAIPVVEAGPVQRTQRPAPARTTKAPRQAPVTVEAVPAPATVVAPPPRPQPAPPPARRLGWPCLAGAAVLLVLVLSLVGGLAVFVRWGGPGAATPTHHGFFEDRDNYDLGDKAGGIEKRSGPLPPPGKRK